MIDVHEPHETIHTWSDFFIHIATIVVGLLIAIGLEQTVEYFHHRHEIADIRESLAEEREQNRRNYQENIRRYLRDAAVLHSNLRVFRYLQQHPGTPQKDLPGVILWPTNMVKPVNSAWTAASETNVLAMMPKSEIRDASNVYFDLNRALQAYNEATLAIVRAAAYSTDTSDPSTLSPERIRQQVDLLEQASALHILYGLWLQVVHLHEPDFSPGLTDEQVYIFASMPTPESLQSKFPEAYDFTNRDIKTAATMRAIKPQDQ